MRLATRALLGALSIFVLSAVVSAQTLRLPEDPRNQSPSVGTGGPEGGATGLFTIYDGSTIRKGEFTFSVAYSNFDRDPGNADIVDTPLSFNVGLNDHVELFFKTNGYRGIKINSPQNLSSFYLPNSQLYFGASLLCTGGAVILPPDRVSGSTALTGFSPLFRPAGPPCNVGGQPFVQFPFVGGVGPNFGLTGNNIAPPFVSRLGTPFGENGNFGAAWNFPGIGSVAGSILPGIILAQRTIPANLTFNPLTVPDTFTVEPSYLPDAPFVNRLYGESSFTNMVIGAKIRFASPTHAVGYGIIPFYRWYPDNADDFSGFNQMQRGAGPGAQLGDFGLIGFFDARLSQHVNISVNGGYILNSNPKSEPMNGAVLLNRPDEFLAGIGIDIPVNKHFQLIGEVRSTMYVGGKTPNAFNNNPVDAIGGVKIYPARWWGIGAAYRRHMNQQDADHFGGALPRGFKESEDPNGFIAQFWIGHRNPRTLPPIEYPPSGSVVPSTALITLPCLPGTSSESCIPSASRSVELTASFTDPNPNDVLLYTWTIPSGSGSITQGKTVTWDLSGVGVGVYEATVTVTDGLHPVKSSATVTVAECKDCRYPEVICPEIYVRGPSAVDAGEPITFSASLSKPENVSHSWVVTAGTITKGQGTSSIEVDTAGLGGQTVTATVTVYGLDPKCPKTKSYSTEVGLIIECNKFDDYGDLQFDDEKARLDNYVIELIDRPDSRAYVIAYGTCAGDGLCIGKSCIVAQKRLDRIKKYMTDPKPYGRGFDAGRVEIIDGGCRSAVSVLLWVCPSGAKVLPAPITDGGVYCSACKKPMPPNKYRRPQRRRGRR